MEESVTNDLVVLEALSRGESLSSAELAHLTQQEIHESCERLEGKGLIYVDENSYMLTQDAHELLRKKREDGLI